MTRVAIIDSGGANIASLRFALARLGCEATLTREAAAIREATHVLLPGVGAAADAMERLRAAGLDTLIPALYQPVLGICLGMQLLFSCSDEGPADCLGVFDDRVLAMEVGANLPIPHMGWNRVFADADCPLFKGIADGDHFYFVHSYAVPVTDVTVATATYGAPFTAAAGRANFLGTQFHPERSGKAGARVLHNFLEMGQ